MRRLRPLTSPASERNRDAKRSQVSLYLVIFITMPRSWLNKCLSLASSQDHSVSSQPGQCYGVQLAVMISPLHLCFVCIASTASAGSPGWSLGPMPIVWGSPGADSISLWVWVFCQNLSPGHALPSAMTVSLLLVLCGDFACLRMERSPHKKDRVFLILLCAKFLLAYPSHCAGSPGVLFRTN